MVMLFLKAGMHCIEEKDHDPEMIIPQDKSCE